MWRLQKRCRLRLEYSGRTRQVSQGGEYFMAAPRELLGQWRNLNQVAQAFTQLPCKQKGGHEFIQRSLRSCNNRSASCSLGDCCCQGLTHSRKNPVPIAKGVLSE